MADTRDLEKQHAAYLAQGYVNGLERGKYTIRGFNEYASLSIKKCANGYMMVDGGQEYVYTSLDGLLDAIEKLFKDIK